MGDNVLYGGGTFSNINVVRNSMLPYEDNPIIITPTVGGGEVQSEQFEMVKDPRALEGNIEIKFPSFGAIKSREVNIDDDEERGGTIA